MIKATENKFDRIANKFVPSLPVLFFGLFLIIHEVRPSTWTAFPDLWDLFLLFGGISAVFYTLFFTFKKKKIKTKFNYLPITLLVVSIIILAMIENEVFKGDVVLYANHDGGYNGMSIELRDDHTYEIDNSSFLGGDYYRGTYIIKSDTIILDKRIFFYDDFYLSKKLFIKDNILYELNVSNNIDKNKMAFTINN